jgi:hypothetical protein
MGYVLAGVSYEALAPSIGRVQALALHLADASADAGFTPELSATLQGVARTFQVAVDSWATKQAQEVVNGTRTLANWQSYGALLEQQATAKMQDVEDQSGWFGKVATWVADKWTAGVDAVAEKIAGIRADVTKISGVRAQVLATRSQLSPDSLTDESRDTLFGAPFAVAEATWTKLLGLVEALEAMVSMVRGGKAKLEAADNGDVRVVPLNGVAYSLVGALPALAAGTVLATIAIAAALAASLWAYFNHANEVVRAELEKQENDMVASGKMTAAQLLQRQQQRNAGQPPTLGETIAKAAAGTAAAGLGIWGLYKLGAHVFDRWFDGRKK